ncbi:MAG TPA: glycerol-3-phosphate 1-O-acyltransferase PlsY [Candidatus Blautia excrementipullorum]|nr:glycerol-3-phosphate 1-O-acyltransferase PlsY [Candidatus Blautia excrementipullorum]
MERIICLAVGYVCGLFQTSYIIGKMHKTDIREHGSGNAGTTNALRTFGKKAGALTLLGDLLKCMIAVFLVRLIFRREYADIMPLLSVYAAAGCILGHNFPVYLKFRGGKGVAASVGFVLAFDWRIFVIGAVVFFTLFFLTHYVSLCSLSAYVTALIVMIIFGQMGSYKMDASHTLEMYAVMAALTVLAFYKHRENIKRLVHGSENRIYLGGKHQ